MEDNTACENNEFTNDEENFKPRKKEFHSSRVCLGQNKCMQYKGTQKVGCIHTLCLDQLLEAQEETLGRW